MNPQGAQSYLRTQVFTASPEQLQMMLYDGAIRFCEQARPALQKQNWESSYNMISRAQRIIHELICGLKRDVAPELCDRLTALYNYVYRKLIEANVQHSIPALDEALKLLRYQRETWSMLMEQLGKSKTTEPASANPTSSGKQMMESSISMRG